jgi:hypothetical protein
VRQVWHQTAWALVLDQLVLQLPPLQVPTIAKRVKGFAFVFGTSFNPVATVKLELDNQVFVEGQGANSLVQNGELWYYPYERPYFNNSVFKISINDLAAQNVNFIVYYES